MFRGDGGDVGGDAGDEGAYDGESEGAGVYVCCCVGGGGMGEAVGVE